MKRFYITLIALVLVSVAGWGQTTKTWNGPASGGSWATAGNWSPSGAPGATNIVVFDNGVSGQITGVPNVTVAGLRVEGNSQVSLVAQSGNNRTLTVSVPGGQTRLVIESGSSLTLVSGGDDIDLNFTRSGAGGGNTLGQIDGTLIVEPGNEADLGNTNTATSVGNGGAIENTGGTVTGAATRLQFNTGSTYSHQRNGGSIPTASWNVASTCEVTGVTTSIPSGFNQSFGNLTWNCPNQSQLESFAASLQTINGNFTVASTGTGQLTLKISGGGGATNTNVAGDFNLTGGFFYIVETSGSHNLNVSGNVNISGGTLARGIGGTANFVFDRTGVQTFTKTGGTISGVIGFRIDNDAEVDFGTSVLDGTDATFTLDAQGKIIVANAAGLSSSGSTGAIQVGGTRTYDSGADYEFRGASTGNFTTAGSGVRDLIINNTSGEVAMGRNFTVSRNLTLENGYITPGANTLLVGTAGNSTSNNNAYVNGQLQKSFNNSSAFTFYVGKSSSVGMRAIGLTTNTGSGTSTFTAEFIRADANTAALV